MSAPPRQRLLPTLTPRSITAPLLALALAGCGDPTPSADSGATPLDASAPLDSALADLAQPPDLTRLPGASVLQYHNHANRDGIYVDPAFTLDAAARLRRAPGFVAKIAGPTYAQPLFLDGGPGGRDLLFVVTEQNQVSALDALSGAVVWQKVLGPPVPLARFACGNIDPLGITGTPVIDFATRTLFLDAMTSPDGGVTKTRLLFALSIDDGAVRPGWPVDVAEALKKIGVTFFSQYQNQRGALALLGDTVYVPYGGMSGDCGSYRGVVVGVRIDDPSRVMAWATRGGLGGVWAPGGISSDGTSLFVSTGNTGGVMVWSDGEAVIRLGPGPTYSQQPADYFSPSDWLLLDNVDLDVGGTAPMLLDVPGATPSKLVVALGKNGKAYLLDRANLGGVGGEKYSSKVANGVIINGAVTWSTAKGVYLGFRGYGACGQFYNLVVERVVPGAPPTLERAWCVDLVNLGSPTVSTSDGTSNHIVWTLGAEGDNRLRGFDADTGKPIFAGGGPGDTLAAINRYQAPIIAKGRLYVAGVNEVVAFTPQ